VEAPITFLKDETKLEIDVPGLVAHGEHDSQQNDSNREKASFTDAFEVALFYIAANKVIILL